MQTILERIHHLFYDRDGLAAVAIVAYLFAPHHDKNLTATVVPTQAPVVAPAGDIHREVQAYLDAQALNAAVHSPVAPPQAMPAVSVVQPVLKGFSAAEVATLLHALGTQKTQPVVHVGIVGPTPGPTATPPPGVTAAAFSLPDGRVIAALDLEGNLGLTGKVFSGDVTTTGDEPGEGDRT